MKELGTRIKLCREANDMTQQELANHLGLTQVSVARMESGKTNPKYSTLVKICKLFSASADYFLDIK